MNNKTKFNYVITIHNKEDLLERVLDGVAACCSKGSTIYPVLDGCTDRSEKLVDSFALNSGLEVIKIITPDVHELKTINAALRQIKEGFTIVLQDDVILQEPDLEDKILNLYNEIGPKLGVVSFRLAANIKRNSSFTNINSANFVPQIEECNFLVKRDDFITGIPKINYGEFRPRMVAIKGPNCIPESVLKTVGLLDEKLAPYGYDDHDYCLRALENGFTNGIFPLKFLSDNDWGGSRRDVTFSKQSLEIFLRNRKYVWQLHGIFIKSYWKSGQVTTREQMKILDYFCLLKERIYNRLGINYIK